MVKKAIITGITGQDGSYLAEFLLSKGYEVHGIIRRSSTFGTERIDHIYQDPHEENIRLSLHYGDLSDGSSLRHILSKVHPQEVYNLAAQSHVGVSFEQPEYTADTTGLGSIRLLEAIKDIDTSIRYYQASSSELYGMTPAPQNENTLFHPCSPYACSKLYSFWQTINYRESYGIFCSNGILFNHESPRRLETFVTRKITRAATRISLGLQDCLYLGNLDTKRDWGFAGDYIEGMWRILQRDEPDDFVIATGEMHSVREFLEEAFGMLNLDWKKYVRIDDKYKRPKDVPELCGDMTKAKEALGWEPKIKFKELVKMMVESDLVLAKRENHMKHFKGQCNEIR